METLVQQLLNGLFLGSIYVLVALGLTLIYRVLKFAQLAHGELAMVGGYLGVWALDVTHNVVLAFLIVVVVMGVGGIVLERFVFRPFLNANHLIPLLVSLAVGAAIHESIRNLVNHGLPVSRPSWVQSGSFEVGTIVISWFQLLAVGITAVCVVAIVLLLQKTNLGMQIRAVADNQEVARLLGINPRLLGSATFFAGTALAGAAGMTYLLVYNGMSPEVGGSLSFKALAVVLLGGMGSITGAVVGGLALGLVEVLTAGYISSSFSDAIAFGVIILILVWRPAGIYGREVAPA
ncbi:MAG: branched-chain amino acid transport system permease protein [Gaiellaceae bacterium]|nr:branched-chain amino acid transport system permease protein [Gaiellaceae bacterium]